MKIAYVTINIDPKIMNGGVGKKIDSQISIWKSMGHSVVLFSLTPSQIKFRSARQFEFDVSLKLPLLKTFARELSRCFQLIALIRALHEYLPDIIYLRYGLYTFPIQYLFRIAPTLLEINSNDIAEYKSRGVFFYFLNLITRNILFSKSAGWIASSYELSNIQANHYYKKPVCVISNGIELKKYIPLQPTKNQTPFLTLVGSPGMNWHGVDKLIPLAEKYPDLNINIVGYNYQDVNVQVPMNMKFHGYLNSENIRKILINTDVVFGTLALHRKNMQEASPLKVREALGYGIPVILAYHDTDLMDVKSDKFLFLPNIEDNILQNVEKIYNFSFQVIGKRIDRQLISEKIDQNVKEKKRLEFFEHIIQLSESKN